MKSMKSETKIPENIDEYIAGFPSEVQAILQKVRTTIAKAAPGAKEAIKYRLPTFVRNGNLVHFGAFQKHIGFFATPTGHAKFRRELSAYEGGRHSTSGPQAKRLWLVRRVIDRHRAQSSPRITFRRSWLSTRVREFDEKR
jgi:hypothetical protein